MSDAKSSNILAVDMDGTFLLTDSLNESFVTALFSKPLTAIFALLSLVFGRATVKRILAPFALNHAQAYPVRTEFKTWLEGQRAKGRELHLVTAADRGVAEAVAAAHPIFSGVMASDGKTNLKGENKGAALKEAFPQGFAYAGDSRADLPVFQAADSIVLVGASSGVKNNVNRLGLNVEAEFPRDRGGLKPWRKAMRLHQWSKNMLLFVPLILGNVFLDVEADLRVLLGFLITGIVASGTYMLNDLADLTNDRVHATKRKRPFASGALAVRDGFVMACGLIGGGLIAALVLSPGYAFLLLAYVTLTLSYSLGLKRIAMLDVAVLAALYSVRIGMGGILANVPLSEWLLLFSSFLFFSLSLAKRTVEITRKKGETSIPGRGYQVADLLVTVSFGVAAIACSLVLLIMYIMFSLYPLDHYKSPSYLWICLIAIALWSMRIWLLAARGELDDDPVAFAVRDIPSLALGAMAAAGVTAAMQL